MEVRANINGTRWIVKVVSAKQMKKQRGPEEPPAGGLCVPGEKTIYLDKDCVDYETIAHEIYHSYSSDLHLSDTNNMSLDDIEEVYAAQFAAKADKMVRQAKRITKELKKLMEQE